MSTQSLAVDASPVTLGDAYAVLGVVAAVLLCALFAGAETAFGRMTLTRARKLQDEGRRGARRVVVLMRSPARTQNILALLVLALQVTVAALVVGVSARRLDSWVAVLTGVVVGTVVLYVVAEVVPKTLAVQQTDVVALATSRIVSSVVRPLAPLAALLIWAGNVIAPGKGLKSGPFVTEDALRELIDVADDDVLEDSEREMIHSIFELGDTVVREIMVPRPDMVTVDFEAGLGEVVDVMLRQGHSRIPVWREDRDRIVGLVYAKDVLGRLHGGGDELQPWHDLLRPPHFVPELKRVDSLLRELQARKVHLAIVIDEYGATAGLVTIEDILEEIVGEIVDEYDSEEELVEELGEGRWRVDAKLPVDELCELVGVKLPDEEWDTAGGLLFGLLGHVPNAGEHFVVESVRLTAERVEGRRIASMLVEQVSADSVGA